MIIKIHNPKHSQGKNTGSSAGLVEYLDKENYGLDELDKVHFFNKEGSHFSAAAVENALDNNKAKLKKTDTKFYMLTVNPSQDELRHIGSDKEKFKSYINELMDTYASNFNRSFKDGRVLTGDDILYFAKIEHERTYKYNEARFDKQIRFNRNLEIQKYRMETKAANKELAPEIRRQCRQRAMELESKFIRNSQGTIIKEGALKDGNNLHAHIVVSRLDKSQQMQLSPMSNHKGGNNILNGKKAAIGFHRDEFVASGEKLFDQKFNYQRDYRKSYEHFKAAKQIRVMGNVMHLRNPEVFAKMAAKRAISEMIKDKTLQKQLDYVITDPRKFPRKVANHLERRAIEAVVKQMAAAAYVTPITAAVQIAKQAASIATKSITKGMGV